MSGGGGNPLRALTPNNWQRLKRLLDQALDQALDRAPEELEAWLSEHCRDAGMRRQIQHLFAANLTATGLSSSESSFDSAFEAFEQPLFALLEPEPEALEIGQKVGPYQIERRLGRGGMGAVYLARSLRRASLPRQVAIKVLRRGLEVKEFRRRLEQERDLLARLDHPGIARFLDAGSTVDGRPYLVMEVVDGEPIDRYCQRHRLSLRARLFLFRRALAAVQAVHCQGIVHGDLKPGHLLVTAGGDVKVIDFGCARISSESAPCEEWVRLPLTPGYASPEQWLGQKIGPSTDVYALAAILWELVTGEKLHPRPEERHQALLYGEEDPALGHFLSSAQGLLQGLAPIVNAALKPSSEQRLPSVEAFDRALDKCLTGRFPRHRRTARRSIWRTKPLPERRLSPESSDFRHGEHSATRTLLTITRLQVLSAASGGFVHQILHSPQWIGTLRVRR